MTGENASRSNTSQIRPDRNPPKGREERKYREGESKNPKLPRPPLTNENRGRTWEGEGPTDRDLQPQRRKSCPIGDATFTHYFFREKRGEKTLPPLVIFAILHVKIEHV
ncbi:hypothetical protein ACOSP7_005240 [Xanthoceras sorbifolium]